MGTYRRIPVLLTLAAMLALPVCCAGSLIRATAESTADSQGGVLSALYPDPASIALNSTENVLAASRAVYQEYRVAIADRKTELTQGQITLDGIAMRVNQQIVGEPDANGYPLYIVLHGGGSSDTPAMNDSQWEQMKTYYAGSLASGVMVAPRGIRDTWDTHFNPESYAFYDRIIEDAVAFENVDPDRVYLLGFSAGGDGVYAIAPRMADRFAAVNMSAGHPNGISLVNLYCLPIFLQVGQEDTAYARNTATAEVDAWLNEAAIDYGGGFIHKTLVHIGKPHNFSDNGAEDQLVSADVQAWLATGECDTLLTDTNAVRLTGVYTREANPTRVVWEVETNAAERNVHSFYWLGRGEGLDRGILVANVDSAFNRITVETCTAESGVLQMYLTASMVDLLAPITVDFCGTVHEVTVTPSLEVMRAAVQECGDPERVYASVLEVDVATGEIVGLGS